MFKGYSYDLDPANYLIDEDNPAPTVTEDGTVPTYGSIMAGFEGAFSIGNVFTFLPKVYVGWYSYFENCTLEDHYLNPKHIVTVGGFIPNRYTERQMPFFGFPNGYRNTRPFSSTVQLDFRFRIANKNFVTARCGAFTDNYALKDFFLFTPILAYGLEFSRQTIVGPFRLAVQYCPWMTGVTAYAGIGFNF